MAYRIGEGFHLYRSAVPLSMRGGVMVVADGGYTGDGDTSVLTGEIMREYGNRGFEGILLDFGAPSPSLHAAASMLSMRLGRVGGTLYLPERYAQDSDWCKVLIPTALSGGSLSARLREAASFYGAQRIALEIERVRMDFRLPAYDGEGTRLTAEAFARLTALHKQQAYFSQELCAYYFTFKDKDGSHFVVYDDAGSIRKKLYLAERLDIKDAVLLYPEISDLFPADPQSEDSPIPN